MSNILEVTDSSFDNEVLKADLPVLVDFWADWCGPCRMVAPVLAEVADSYTKQLKIVKLNVDTNQQTASNYNIRGIPTLLLFKQGAIVASKVGALSKPQLIEFLDSHI